MAKRKRKKEEPAVVVCTRLSEAGDAMAPWPTERASCRECDEDVVVTASSLREYEANFGKPAVLVCSQCVPSLDDGEDTYEVKVTRTTVLEMLETGMGPLELASMLALMEMARSSHPNDPRVFAIVEQVTADPEGDVATQLMDLTIKKLAEISVMVERSN